MNSQADFTVDGEVGVRLRSERRKLGFNQKDFAQVGGVTLNTQGRYEAGNLPATEYLLRIGAVGADWYWIITGQRITGETLERDAAELVALFRKMPDAVRHTTLEQLRAILAALDAAETFGRRPLDPELSVAEHLHDPSLGFKPEAK